jgi:hypothetical protein
MIWEDAAYVKNLMSSLKKAIGQGQNVFEH